MRTRPMKASAVRRERVLYGATGARVVLALARWPRGAASASVADEFLGTKIRVKREAPKNRILNRQETIPSK